MSESNGLSIKNIFEHDVEIRSFQGCDKLITKRQVGIEVELENIGLLPQHLGTATAKYWDIIEDGSLRNGGREFVLAQPLCGLDLYNALASLEDIITDYCQTHPLPDINERTSLHVHLDMRGASLDSVIHLLALFSIFERAFFEVFGKGREGSNYCVPLFEEGRKRLVSDILERRLHRSAVNQTIGHSSKYGSVNVKSLRSLGTVEFRLHQATWLKEEILLWVNILLSLADYAENNELDLSQFSRNISEMGFESFMNSVFFEDQDIITKLTYPRMGQDILMGIRDAQDIILQGTIVKLKSSICKGSGPQEIKEGHLSYLESFCLKQEIDYEYYEGEVN